jgi:hypothetical protein
MIEKFSDTARIKSMGGMIRAAVLPDSNAWKNGIGAMPLISASANTDPFMPVANKANDWTMAVQSSDRRKKMSRANAGNNVRKGTAPQKWIATYTHCGTPA